MKNIQTTNYKLQTTSEGFTLVELVLWLGLVVIILASIATFVSNALEARVKNQTIAEVNSQARQIIQLIGQTVRNAEGIVAPSIGSSSSSLTLNMVDPILDPTVFDLNNGVIRIAEGVGATPVELTNSRITVTNLTFTNLSRALTPGTVRIEFTIVHNNPGTRQEFEYTEDFTTSATVRPN